MRFSRLLAALSVFVLLSVHAAAQRAGADLSDVLLRDLPAPFMTGAPIPPGSAFVAINAAAFDGADPRAISRAVIDRFPLGAGRSVRLELERFDVMAPAGIAVAGTDAGDVPFTPEKHLIFKGRVDGIEGSFVYLAVFRRYCVGFIDIPGPNGTGVHYGIGPDNAEGVMQPTMIVYDARLVPGSARGHVECGAENLPGYQERADEVFRKIREADDRKAGARDRGPQSATMLAAQIAVDCDIRYYQAHASSISQSANYALVVLGASSAVYQRDAGVMLQVPYLRIWTTIGPYTGPNINDLLGQVRGHWTQNMGSVGRSTTVLLSYNIGGGLAWVNVLCGDYGFAVAGLGNTINFPVDHYEWDVDVTSHELGHNFGSPHTHNCSWAPPIDSCVAPEGGCANATNPHPGSIMSYCHLNAGTQLYLHPRVATLVRKNFELAGCAAPVGGMLGNDLAAVLITAPALGGKITRGASFTPSAIIRNIGTAAQSGVPVTLSFNPTGAMNLVYTSTQNVASIAPGASVTVTFAPVALDSIGVYDARVSIALAADVSQINNAMVRPFEVVNAASAAVIKVLSPNGGETFAAGSTVPVQWTATGASDVTIQYSSDNGNNWTVLHYSQPATPGTLSWVVPAVPTTQGRIRVNDLTDASARDISDGPFTVTVGKDVEALEIVAPIVADTASTPLAPSVVFRNNGSQIARDVPVRLRMMWRGNGVEVYNQSRTIAEIAPGAVQTVDFPATPLLPAGTHVLIARAMLEGDEQPANDSVGRTSDFKGLTPPLGLKALPMSHSVLLTWVASPSPDILSYQLFRGTSPETMVPIATLRPTVLAYADNPLDDGTTYYYGLTTKTASKQSIFSQIVSATPATYPAGFTLAAPNPILPEQDKRDVPTWVDFLWHTLPGAEIYQLQIGAGAAMNDIIANVFTRDVRQAYSTEFGSDLYWRVRAFNYSSVSPWSATRHFTTQSNCAGSALAFNGADTRMTAPVFNWSDTAVTVEFWNYVRSSEVKNSSAFSVGTDATSDRFQSHAPWSDRVLYWDYGNIEADGRVSANYAPYLDKWTHVALVSNGKDFKGIYFDGQLVASGDKASFPSARTNLVIGSFGNEFHKGMIDEFRIWNRVRTQEEIQADMSRRISAPQPGLAGYWRFDENVGAIAADLTGNGANGSLSADTLWAASNAPINCDYTSLGGTAPTPIAPANGTQFTVRVTPGLTWTAVPKATAYQLQIATEPGFHDLERQIPDVTALTHTVTGLHSGTTYHWRVRAINGDGAGSWSAPVSFTTADACATNAVQFDGTRLMIHADSFMYRGRAATVEFWNYVSTAGVRSSSAFSVGATDDVADRFQSHAPWSDKNIYWDFGDIGTTGRISTNYAPYLDKWTHVALVSNGTDFKAIYLDGKEVASATTADTASGRSSLTIGGVLSTWFHPGTMSEFRIWNTARTVEAIRHDMYRRLPSPQSGLLGYWSLDEGQGASAHDSSGFSHDGLIATDTAWTQGMLPLDPLPVPISGPAIVRIDSSTHRYSAPLTGGNRYAWSVIGGTIVGGAGGADVDVMWTDSSGGIVSLRVDREDGCADSVYMPVGARVGAGVDRDDPVTGLAFTSAPDPFSGSTVIRYTLTRRERVDLAVYSLDGTLVTRLADGIQDAGGHEAVFSGAGLASGVYLCRLGVGDGYLYVKALRLVR